MGALAKSDDSFRPLHDGTHGAAVNPNLRIRDQIKMPTSPDVDHAIPEGPYRLKISDSVYILFKAMLVVCGPVLGPV